MFVLSLFFWFFCFVFFLREAASVSLFGNECANEYAKSRDVFHKLLLEKSCGNKLHVGPSANFLSGIICFFFMYVITVKLKVSFYRVWICAVSTFGFLTFDKLETTLHELQINHISIILIRFTVSKSHSIALMSYIVFSFFFFFTPDISGRSGN